MISIAHNFLFVHVPKTAGNSVQNVLINYSEDRIVTNKNQDGVERFGIESPTARISKHSNLKQYRKLVDPAIYGKLYKFGCVRNPWDRMISYYFSPHRKTDTFVRQDFFELLDKSPTSLSYLTLDGTSKGTVGVDFIMKFESLSADFSNVCQKLGIDEQPLPHRNSSKRMHYSTYYDQEMIDRVAEKYRREIKMFGYSFEKPD